MLMDMQMPVMDGYTATKEIREWETEKGIMPTPIIALTANALKEDAQRSLDVGCTAHLTKPIRKPPLLAAIHEHTKGSLRRPLVALDSAGASSEWRSRSSGEVKDSSGVKAAHVEEGLRT